MEKELSEAGGQGVQFVGITVADTLVGGNEDSAAADAVPRRV